MDGLIEGYKKLGYVNIKEVPTDNGTGYFMANKYGTGAVYLPPNATSADALVGLHPGSSNPYAGESQSGTSNYKSYINNTILKGQAPEGTIFVIANDMKDYSHQVNAVDVAFNNGVNLANVGVVDFSYSGKSGMVAAGQISHRHPEVQVRVANIDASMLNAYYQGVYNYQNAGGTGYDGAVKANINNDVTVLSIVPVSDHPGWENAAEIKAAVKDIAYSGHSSYMIESTGDSHGSFFVEFINGGGIDWAAGKGELHGSTYVKVMKYDKETGKWVESDVNELEGAGVKIDGKIIRVKSDVTDANALYNELKENGEELSVFAKLYNNGESNTTLASNLSYVSNSMKDIKGMIVEHTNLDYQKADGEAGVISAFHNAVDYYGGVSNLLYTKLSAETEAVYGIANAIYSMDKFASVIGESTLTDGVTNLFNSSSLKPELEKLASASISPEEITGFVSTKYNDLSNILKTNTTPGSVGKISVSSLKSAISRIIPSLEAEVNTANNLKTGINDFIKDIGNANILKGNVWENVKTNMINYDNLLSANIKASEFVSDAVQTAMGIITDYIDSAGSAITDMLGTDYKQYAAEGELDDSKLPDVQIAVKEMKTKVDEQEAKVKEMEEATVYVTDYGTNAEGKTIITGGHYEKKYSEAQIKPERDALEGYKEILKKVETFESILRGFSDKVNTAQKIIEDAVEQVKEMYEKPNVDNQGNMTFNTNLNLDLSPYSDYIDTSKDYKHLLGEYYNKILAEEAEKAKEQEKENEGTNDYPNYGNYGNPGNAGTPVPQEDSNPETPDVPQVTPTPEVPTEDDYIGHDNLPPEDEIIIPDEDIIEEDTGIIAQNLPFYSFDEPDNQPPSSGIINLAHHGHIESNPNLNMDPLVVEDVPVNSIDKITDTPVINEYTETIINKPVLENLVNNTPNVQEQPKPNGLKTMGIASGVGIALGAVSLGAHSIIRNKEEKDDNEDYGYKK